MECEYCVNTASEIHSNEEFGLGVSVTKNNGKYYLWLDVSQEKDYSIDASGLYGHSLSLAGQIGQIHYCPICGRELANIGIITEEGE